MTVWSFPSFMFVTLKTNRHKRGENGVNRGTALWPELVEREANFPVGEGGTTHATITCSS